MANWLSAYIKKKIIGKNRNLVSLDSPYKTIGILLKGRRVTGIVDAGASNGRISKKLMTVFPDSFLYAFEPNMLYKNVLEQYAKENSRFHPFFVALSDHEGIVDLHVTESPGNTSLFTMEKSALAKESNGANVKSVERIKAVTLDGWAKENNISGIQVMKFDIQGGELLAFRGAANMLQTSTLLVYTEILFNPMYKGGAIYSEIDQCLREYGFILYDIFKPKYNSNGLLMWGNAVFVHAKRLGL